MPFLDIRLSAPCLPENVAKIAARMTDLTVEVLGKRRELTSVAVQCVAPGHWYVGGADLSASGRASFFVEVNVTAGTNSSEEKATFVAAAFAAAEAILGKLDAASYVIVREVVADAWGYQGLTQAARAAQRLAQHPGSLSR
ncbi:MAG: 4-oxalocrotonate tautomerase [Rhodocyclaceae bacterium]|jgi:4-oxalocrotonate tautomerase|nr:4-oxalocrotonate tautomerase [Rhodocyclaceae bacterium]